MAEPGKAERVRRALASPAYFGEVYVRPFDESWTTPIPDFGQDMLRFALRAKRGVVVLPPEFLKTTLLSQVLPLWLTYRATVLGRLLRGMIASEEQGMAEHNLSVLTWHIENNDLLARDFCDDEGRPLVYPDPQEDIWRDDAIIVARAGTSKDPTWQAKGLDSKGVQGRRLDWLVADDLITPKNASSPAMRRKAIEFWDLQFTTRLVRDAHALICGNFNDARDLLSSLADRDGYRVFRRPALHKKGEPSVADSDGEVLWPDNWPKSRLAAERREKPNRFRRIFLLDARAEMGEQLKIEWVTVINSTAVAYRTARYYISVDPAPGSEGDNPDYFNISVGALTEQNLDLVQSLDVRADAPRQVELLGMIHDRYQRMGQGVVAIGGAKITVDRYFRGAVTIARPDLSHKLVEISMPGPSEERLQALGPYASSGWLRVVDTVWFGLTSGANDQWQELSLFEQWRDFPQTRHDDKLDGLDVLIRTAREFSLVGDIDYELAVLSE